VRRFSICFVKSAGAILLLTGAAKVVSSLGQAKVLALQDPILGLSFGKLMLVVGLVELVIAVLCLLPSASPQVKLGLVTWVATSFLAYRIGLWAVDWHRPCGCMGALAGALHLSDQMADNVMKALLVYLLTGSYLLLYIRWRRTRPIGVTAGVLTP